MALIRYRNRVGYRRGVVCGQWGESDLDRAIVHALIVKVDVALDQHSPEGEEGISEESEISMTAIVGGRGNTSIRSTCSEAY